MNDAQRIDERIVDNRVFLLGLDQLYREAMKGHERGELLACARRVAGALGVTPADVAIEGYYTEEPELTEYFRLVRALQAVGREARSRVDALAEFQRLLEVRSSPLFGRAQFGGGLLPAGRDPLSQALDELLPRWNIPDLTRAARRAAEVDDDFSLVGLAARAEDAVVLTALRESVVLYAELRPRAFLSRPRPRYVWRVDDALARAARRLVDTFNALFGDALPQPEPSQAAYYWVALTLNNIAGRCVRIGYDESVRPIQHYHWAICRNAEELMVQEFWKPEVWTTARYRSLMRDDRCL